MKKSDIARINAEKLTIAVRALSDISTRTYCLEHCPKAAAQALREMADRLEKREMAGATDPIYKQHFPEFVKRLEARLEVGAREYGDKSFDVSPDELMNEVEEELLDVCGWAFIQIVKLQGLRTKVVDIYAELGEAGERGGVEA